MFSIRETRKIDSGISFLFRGEKYRLPVYSDKGSLSKGETITVATSHMIGIKVIYKGLVMSPLQLEKRIRKSVEPTKKEPSKKPYKQAKDHPWRKYPPNPKPKGKKVT